MVDKGASSTYEEWGLNGSWRRGKELIPFMRTQSHAWSAYPAEYLIRDLAGFEIVEPGCRKVKVKPKETSFDYALAIPVPQGEISVCRSNGRIEIAAPDGVMVI
jgi:hypothetical protein